MGPDGHDPGIEGIHHSLEDLQAHGPHHIGGPGRLEQVIKTDGSQGRGRRGAGHQGQPFLGSQGKGLQSRLCQGVPAFQQFPLIPGFPPSGDHQGHVGLRAQVSHAAVSRSPGRHSPVQELPDLFQHFQTDPAVSLAQILEHHQKGSPDRFFRQRFPYGHGMGQDDVLLELGSFFPADGFGAQGPETGGDPVHDFFFFHPFFHQGSGPVHPFTIPGRKFHRCMEPGHGHEIFQIDFRSKDNCLSHGVTSLPVSRSGLRCPQCPFWFLCP